MRTVRTDKARAGDLIMGTSASGNYPDGMLAFQLTWTDGTSNVYYGDTALLLAQRP